MAAAAKPVQVYTDEKARRLMRTFGASLAFAGLLCWFEIVILRPSLDMAKEMVGFVVCLVLHWGWFRRRDSRIPS